MLPTHPAPHFSDRIRSSDEGTSKSLTPQRKHRKLMKDGSGIEVWPESVEKIFVQGLRKYWESPYATYSQSRGRSRWRNQFLVDYLKKAGVERSKKQVASHIQVLRNMWKGEPEYHLVAGGDELYPEPPPPSHSTNIKAEDQWDPLVLRYPDYDDAESSSNSTSPNFSPPEVKTEFPPSPGQPLRPFPPETRPTNFYASHPSAMSPNSYAGSSLESSRFANYIPSNYTLSSPSNNYTSVERTSVNAGPVQSFSEQYMGLPMNRVKALKLTAEGMSPFTVKLDALTSAGQLDPRTPLALKIRLGINFVTDLDTPATVLGFTGSVHLENMWSFSGRCLTNVYINGVGGAPEDGPLTACNASDGSVTAALPESQLSRCRWLDPSASTIITQEIIADNETLLFIVYVLDRKPGKAMPWAQLSSYQRHNVGDKAGSAAPSSTNAYSYSSLYTPTPNQYSRYGSQMSFSYTTMPMNRYAVPTS
ncbi:hypothetical protein AMATHDRAFT_72875 [Amanita thiersii Skay4041]|uniref:TEA domain-containing protein n=1 Tax=Amanita thiersii Skay4041 TaxID=703135 RepID=A0A2A9P0A7_9AGAR|nr:hypothetical protein AMATHDRAFT_72875 [Amanita thiersii Skay4041]